MIKYEDMYLRNLSGILMYDKMPILKFQIENGVLSSFEKLSGFNTRQPAQLALWGISYSTINEFFKDRVVLDVSQDIKEYLDALGMNKYNFEAIVKYHNGRNYLDSYWVKDMV